MAKIKSALELALEKTADLKADPKKVRRDELSKKAKSTISLILSAENDPESWAEFHKELEGEETSWALQAARDVILANLNLPRINEDLQRLARIQQLVLLMQPALEEQINGLFQQAAGIFQQYLDSRDEVREKLMEQVEQQLARKEAMLSQQTGRQVNLTPQDDPEIMKMVTEQLQNFDDQYKQFLSQMKEELQKLF